VLTGAFLTFTGALTIMAVMEISTIAIGLMVGVRSFNKETGGAMKYLLLYTVIFRILMLIDLSLGVVDNLVFLGGVGMVRCSIFTFYSKLPVFRFHQWLPKAHVEVTARASAILGGIMLKFGAPVVRATIGIELGPLVVSSVITIFRLRLMSWCRDFKVWVAFSSITHMSLMFLCMFKYVSSAVGIYLMAHTLLSSSMFWHFSKEYQMRRTRSFYHFNNYGDSWLTYIWLRLPIFITFVIELHLFEKLFYFELSSSLLFFRLMVYFIVVALMMCHSSISSDSVADSEGVLCYWMSYIAVSWFVLIMWFSI